IEDKTISYVGSGREIVRLAQAPATVKTHAPLVMGNPDFDLDLHGSGEPTVPESNSQPGSKSLLTSPPTRSLSRDYRGIKFTSLAGAEQEAKNVAGLLGNDCVLRLRKDARESELKAVVSPRVLHLATHGFFLSDQEFKRTNGVRESWT